VLRKDKLSMILRLK